MRTRAEILNEVISEELPKMLLPTEVETKKHNGIEYRMINESICLEAMRRYAAELLTANKPI
jgi:hypothetical protein